MALGLTACVEVDLGLGGPETNDNICIFQDFKHPDGTIVPKGSSGFIKDSLFYFDEVPYDRLAPVMEIDLPAYGMCGVQVIFG